LNQFQPASQFQARGNNAGFQGQQSVSPQSYHTANYRGSQPGHDNSLRADSTQPSTPNARGGYQSRGFTTSVPVSGVGVQSSFASQQQFGQSNAGRQQQFGQQASPQSYHTANYRGNQPGHDNSLRADSTQPSTPNARGGYQSRGFTASVPVSGSFGAQSSFGSQQQFGQSNTGIPRYSQQGGSQSYHTANYRGNQPGHDNSLRADSTQPSTPNARGGYQSRGFTTSAPVSGFGGQSGAGQQQQFGQQANPQSYHTANYQGNQPGHDNSLRADSTQPSTPNAQGGYQGRGFTTSVPVSGFGAQSSSASQQQPFSNRF
jgi:hypothetical protein